MMLSLKVICKTLQNVLICACMLAPTMPASAAEIDKGAVEKCFNGYKGVFVMHDTAGKTSYQCNDQLVSKAVSPLSTFKIFLALIGLETGAIKDESAMEKWDGTKASIETWNRDHNLETAMNESVNWYFQRISSKIGQAELTKYVKLLHYGNADMSSGVDTWMSPDSSLRISPLQQVDFIEHLYKENLPLSARSQQIVKRILKVDEGPKGVLYGKTGTEGVDGKLVGGWFVGYLEGKGDTYVFATNIHGTSEVTGRKAREISKKILKQLGLW